MTPGGQMTMASGRAPAAAVLSVVLLAAGRLEIARGECCRTE